MDQVQSITNPIREKEKHLTFENRGVIQTRLRDKCSVRRIARELVLPIPCAMNWSAGRCSSITGARQATALP